MPRHSETFGGCIRFYPFVTDADGNVTGGPTWHTDELDHHAVGVDTSIQPWIDPGSGYLHFYMLEKNPIITGYMSADETLGAKGIDFRGPSNGTKLVRFLCRKDNRPWDLRIKSNYDYLVGKYNNAWTGITQNVPDPEPAPEPVNLDDLVTPATLATLRLRDILALRALGDALEQ